MGEEDADLVRQLTTSLGSFLREAGLTRAFIRRMTERGDDLWSPLTPTREAIYSDDPAAMLLRLFFCREEVEASAVPTVARDAGLLIETAPGRLQSPLHLRLVRDLYLFSDYLDSGPDAVMGAGETTAILYGASRPAQRVNRVLDLGCGAGTLALLLAADSERVIGTDINPRAVEISCLNARVNGITNTGFRAGDVFASVAGERFDLIVSQPPYYPDGAAGSGLTFLHAGARGDEIASRVMEAIPAHLTDKGRALVFTSWPEDRGPFALDGCDVIELFTNRRELHHTRQSLDVVRRGSGWTSRFEAPADSWGAVTPARIDAIFAAEALLRGPEPEFLAAALGWTPGISVFHEGSQIVMRGEPESLAGCIGLDDSTYAAIMAVDAAESVGAARLKPNELTSVKAALRRGWMTVAKLETITKTA